LRGGRNLIEGVPVDVVLRAEPFGLLAHGVAGLRITEPVAVHDVLQLLPAGRKRIAPPRVGVQVKARVGHRLGAAGQDEVGLPGLDHGRPVHNRHHAGGTHHVYGVAVDAVGNSCLERGLTRHQLSLSGPKHIAENVQIESAPVDVGTVERRPHDRRGKVDRRMGFEGPAEAPNRGSHGRGNVDVTHGERGGL
jgi:hypothetical protein